jgi:hypothetical protein
MALNISGAYKWLKKGLDHWIRSFVSWPGAFLVCIYGEVY